jgi:ribonuclease D
VEWVLHAASQDLPCLAELNFRPRRLFDTELAARLAGFERVGLAALTEQLLGYSLEKHHSAADWSTRPLPASWLTYAALDVELLVDLRDALAADLERQGKAGWAAEEFAALVRWGSQPPRSRPEPWRRTSGIHRIRGARAQARVRAIWYARDTIAARRDSAPGRVLPDAAIIAAAELDPKEDERALFTLPGFGGRSTRRLSRVWLQALDDARELPDEELPTTPPLDGPPPPHRWAERDPVAAGRLYDASPGRRRRRSPSTPWAWRCAASAPASGRSSWSRRRWSRRCSASGSASGGRACVGCHTGSPAGSSYRRVASGHASTSPPSTRS